MTGPDLLSSYLTQLQPYLTRYGYWAVSAGVLLEDFGIPVPGEALLIAGAFLAAQGDLGLVPLLLCAWGGAVLGDNIGYAVGRFGGRRLVVRFGRYVGITRPRLGRAEGFLRRYGAAVVVGARFFELLRQLNGIVAGTGRMTWWRFLAANALGAALWVGAWGLLAYRLGPRLSSLLTGFKRVELLVVVGFLLLVAGLIALALVRHFRRPDPPGEA